MDLNIIRLVNPVETAKVLQGSYVSLSDSEFFEIVEGTLSRAEEFFTHNDEKFSISLSDSERVDYACHIRSFLEVVHDLEKFRKDRRIASIFLSRTVAWWQVISAFRSLHGDPTLDE